MESLGINIVNLLINLVLFGVFYLVMHKLVLPKIASVLTKRQELAELGAKNLDHAKTLSQNAQTSYDNKISEAKAMEDKILNEARAKAENEASLILKKAHEESKRILSKANEVVEAKKQALETEFEQRLDISVKQALQKILKDQASQIRYDATVLKEINSEIFYEK